MAAACRDVVTAGEEAKVNQALGSQSLLVTLRDKPKGAQVKPSEPVCT